MANVLIACEYSGKVRDAFARAGHNAVSCDLLPTDVDGPHYQGDVFDIIEDPSLVGVDHWDLMVAHPPCTHLSVSGARWWAEKRADGRQQEALNFVQRLMDCGIPRIAVENPVGLISTAIRPATQYIQPYEHGHGETKRTGLWLEGLPALVPSDPVDGREQRVWRMAPSADRWKQRSETFSGIAQAMADQWGPTLPREHRMAEWDQ